MQYKSLYFSEIAYKHFGYSMSIIVKLLSQYNSLSLQDLYKLISIEKKFNGNELKKDITQFNIIIGIKHQIITFVKDQLQLNENALIGREYIPEFLFYQKDYTPIIQVALSDGLFTQESVKQNQLIKQEDDVYEIIMKMIEEDFITQIQVDESELIQEQTKQITKKQKKNQKSENKIISKESILKINWNSIRNYLKQQELLRQIQLIYGDSIHNFFQEYLKLKKSSLGNIEVQTLITNVKVGKQSDNMIKDSLELMDIIYSNPKQILPKDGLEKVLSRLRSQIEHKWIKDQYSQQHSRIIAILKDRKKIDDMMISDVALLEITDTRAVLMELVKDKLIHTISSKAENSNKIIQYYLYDQRKIDDKLLTHFYKMMLNVYHKNKQVYLGILNQFHLI